MGGGLAWPQAGSSLGHMEKVPRFPIDRLWAFSDDRRHMSTWCVVYVESGTHGTSVPCIRGGFFVADKPPLVDKPAHQIVDVALFTKSDPVYVSHPQRRIIAVAGE